MSNTKEVTPVKPVAKVVAAADAPKVKHDDGTTTQNGILVNEVSNPLPVIDYAAEEKAMKDKLEHLQNLPAPEIEGREPYSYVPGIDEENRPHKDKHEALDKE